MIPLAVMTWFRTNPRNVWLIAGLVAVVAVLLFVYMKGRSDAHAKDEARRKIAVAAAVKSDEKADTKSTEALAREAIEIDAKQKELEDAVAKIPDSTPDAVAVAAGCVELRRNGISVADLPACRAPG
jgi:hypothetical protein